VPKPHAAVSALRTSSADHQVREIAFDPLAKLAEYAGELLAQYKESFFALFPNSVNDASTEVRNSSLKDAAAVLLTLEDKQKLAAFATIIIPCFRL
jgi:hypothetical protein